MDIVSFTHPIDRQFSHAGLEADIAQAFKVVFEQLYGSAMRDLVDYGSPHMGSPAVVERFTKQDGLVVLRRPVTSAVLMRVIYANWVSLASERGLDFLEFMLRMLWANEWVIKRLWHPVDRRLEYPRLATTDQKPGYFLTSRIFLSISEAVSMAEIVGLTPILRRLVPANVVVKVHARALDIDAGVQAFGVAMAGKMYMMMDLS